MSNLRVGNGYDVHQLDDNLELILGGIKVPSSKGIIAHSDGDILIHAVSDALLGAAGLGDIGHFFPDTDLRNKGIDSSKILADVCTKLKKESFLVVNVDATIVLQTPKLSSFIVSIKNSLSNLLGIQSSRVNIKATTGENMGFVGRGEGIACYATVLIEKT